MRLSCESFVFDPRPNYPLVSTVKRYWDPKVLVNGQSLSLIFAHGSSFHKEHWEAIIEDLWDLYPGSPCGATVGEVWAIDAPNHGDAAILNEKELIPGLYDPMFRWEEYGRSIHMFLAGLGTGIDVDFQSRRLVGIGHSMGATSLVLSTSFTPATKYESLILIEPMIFDGKVKFYPSKHLEDGAIQRRDIWPNKAEAFASFSSRRTWKSWDPRILRAYVEYGLRPLPTLQYPTGEGVTLKCTRAQELACYRDTMGFHRCFHLLRHVAERLPTHIFYGVIDDYVSVEQKEAMLKETAGSLASVARIEGGGHLVTQTAPRNVAKAIYKALDSIDAAKFKPVQPKL